MKFCSICKRDIEDESPAVLTMGRSMNPRYVCAECEGLLDTASGARDVQAIKDAMAKIGERLSACECEDSAVISTVSAVLDKAKERAQAIENGTYDFSLDDAVEEEYELSEDMMETEEDRELDRAERESEARFDKFLNWAWLGIGIGVVAYLVWLFFFK